MPQRLAWITGCSPCGSARAVCTAPPPRHVGWCCQLCTSSRGPASPGARRPWGAPSTSPAPCWWSPLGRPPRWGELYCCWNSGNCTGRIASAAWCQAWGLISSSSRPQCRRSCRKIGSIRDCIEARSAYLSSCHIGRGYLSRSWRYSNHTIDWLPACPCLQVCYGVWRWGLFYRRLGCWSRWF